ncbi:uncharacterized protein LOC119643154 [Glossina fuscipes]|uniref:Uncharacterized protein LOC119643154 n=1 Tax=Glossina fuscipes TaxID=7396 RepID=A0A9C6DZN9_9MUSC|nr:uncharacterized protein LOC119643154 [Glossina fuscipes]
MKMLITAAQQATFNYFAYRGASHSKLLATRPHGTFKKNANLAARHQQNMFTLGNRFNIYHSKFILRVTPLGHEPPFAKNSTRATIVACILLPISGAVMFATVAASNKLYALSNSSFTKPFGHAGFRYFDLYNKLFFVSLATSTPFIASRNFPSLAISVAIGAIYLSCICIYVYIYRLIE